jgi:hypothetical protein
VFDGGLTNAEGSDRAQTRHDDATHGIEGGYWLDRV